MAFTSLCFWLCCLSAAAASVQIRLASDRSQFFRYDRIALRCEGDSSGWVVKSKTQRQTGHPCEPGWATECSTCTVDKAYPEDTGEYWCQSGNAKSNTINITVTAQTVALRSPVHPVMEGDNVTLQCYYKEEDDDGPRLNFEASFYKDGVFIGKGEAGKLTLTAVSMSKHEGFYKCQHTSDRFSPESWLAVRPAASVQITVASDRSQFFKNDRIALNCKGHSSGWVVKRNTQRQTDQPCDPSWAIECGSTCTVAKANPEDTGEYWCQSGNAKSSIIDITVTAQTVALRSPVHPVVEGDNVTLHCYYKKEDDDGPTLNFEASFYKDGVFIGKGEAGKLTLTAVSKSKHEGFYKCQHTSGRFSPKSWLAVRLRPLPPTTPPPPPFVIDWIRVLYGILFFILYTIILIFCIYKYCKWSRARARAKKSSSSRGLLGGIT